MELMGTDQLSKGTSYGQVERTDRSNKHATTTRYHYEGEEQRRVQLKLFLDAYKHARRLMTIKGLTLA